MSQAEFDDGDILQQYNAGLSDGFVGRKPQSTDSAYMAGWNEGREDDIRRDRRE